VTGDARLRPAFAADLPHVRASLGEEDLLLTHMRESSDVGAVEVSATPEDAFAVVFQCGRLPGHSIWQDGRRVDVEAGPANSVGIIDLAGAVSGRIGGAFDSLHFRVSRAALDRLADQGGGRRATRLQASGAPFTGQDPVIGRLAPALIAAAGASASPSLFADHLLIALLAHVADRYGQREETGFRSGGLAPWQQRRAKEMLDAVDGPAPALAMVAAACGVSVAHFSRAFKLSVGCSPWAWHQARRIERAQALLRDGGLSLAVVAAQAGFADQSHFTRAFARQVGLTPGRWRRDRGVL
jgi:AraC family transcriptional regulator